MNLPINATAFDAASKRLLDRFETEYGWMYATTVTPATGKPFPARIDFTIWSEVYTCPHCGGEVVFYDAAFNPHTGRVREDFSCPTCGAQLTKSGLERRTTRQRTFAGDVVERIELRPVRIAWRADRRTGQKPVDEQDLAVLEKVRRLRISGFPSANLPLRQMVHGTRLGPKGFTRAHHLWSDRALASLAVLWSWAEEKSDLGTSYALRFWIEQAFWGLSWMNRYVPTHYSHVNQYLSGVYYVPSLHAEPSLNYNLVGSTPSRGKRKSLVKLWSDSPAKGGK